MCLEAASQCALAAASLRASNAVIAAFPAVGRGEGPENEVGSVNIEPNYANELRKRLSCRVGGLIGGPSLQGTPPPPPPAPRIALAATAATWDWDGAWVTPNPS